MCGITGIHAFNQIGSIYMINLIKAMDKLEKRGPDWRGSFVDGYTGLGHRRLSIIDTSPAGSQPMKDETGRYVIVFNGEIFNYRELKKYLEGKGETFSTGSDTEVLLRLFIREGKDCLRRLVGFFAFAVYDKEEKSLFIARDRMGIKPLVYYRDEDKFIFASEIKALLAYNIPAEMDYASLYQYLQLHYIPAPATIYKNIFKLEPGQYIFIKNKKVETGSYYTIPYVKEETMISDYEQQKLKLTEVLEASVKLRLIADVPLGAFLSGGIDSSVIVALASRHTDKLNTFSIGFRDEPFFDETRYADLVAKKFNTEHTVFSLSNDDLFDHFFSTLDYLDEPFGDSSALPMYILSRHTAKKVKVALSGDGADELFGGYNKHQAEYRARNRGLAELALQAIAPFTSMFPASRNSPAGNKIRQIQRFAEGIKLGDRERYWRWASFTGGQEAMSLLNKESRGKLIMEEFNNRKYYYLRHIREEGSFNDVLRTDMELVLPNDMMFKADMMSMANSLEVRVPFLDHRVVEFAFSLPSSFKVDRRMKKKILQDAFRDILPAELYRRPKHGFDVPLLKWYKRELRQLIREELFSDDFVEQQGLFELSRIKKLKNDLFSGGTVDQEQVWALLVFQYWWKKHSPLK